MESKDPLIKIEVKYPMVRASVDVGPVLGCCLVHREAFLVLKEGNVTNLWGDEKSCFVLLSFGFKEQKEMRGLTCRATTASWGSSGSGAARRACITSTYIFWMNQHNFIDNVSFDLNTEKDCAEGHCSSPLVLQDVQADCSSYTWHIWMPDFRDKSYLKGYITVICVTLS